MPVTTATLWTATLPNVVFYSALGVLATIVTQFSNFDRTRDYIYSGGGANSEENFDFVIVGAGSAGTVLANRLSRKFKVLVLEAGGQPNPLMGIPIMAFPMESHPEIDWTYFTEPQTNACLGLNGRRSRWPRGKAEGGSSNLNAMIYLRGHPQDYNSLAERLEDPIWSYRSIVKFYKKLEDFDDHNPNHGQHGEQSVEINSHNQEMTDAFVAAGRELGFPTPDLNSDYTEGFAPLTFTTKRGVRWEDYLVFLKPAKESPLHRLSVYKYSRVVRVLIDKNRRAYGVEYKRHGVLRRAFASKEIIVSAGAINSPQLLMLSGIGPRAHLKSLGIPVIADLPVGQNLQDHVGTVVGMFSVDYPITTSLDRDAGFSTFLEYFYQGTGALSSAFVNAVGCVDTNYSRIQKWPDIQMTLLSVSQPLAYESMLQFFNIRPEIIQSAWKRTAGLNTFQIFLINARPNQRGEITLKSRIPEVPPRIDPKYLQNQNDVQVLVKGMKLSVKLVTSTDAFRRLGGKLHAIPLGPCGRLRFGSDAYWECHLRHLTLTLYHPCCTVPMGNSRDKGRVTDSHMRVVGIQNLRVIDGSSFPTIPSVNLNAPINLLGEVGAHLICKQWTGKSC